MREVLRYVRRRGRRNTIDLLTIDPASVRVECINPDRYTQRWELFRAAYATSALLSRFTLHRFRATPAEDLVPPPTFTDMNQPHYYACTIDHATIIRRSLERGDALLLVFEDDATIEPNFDAVLLDTMKALPSDWIGLTLGSHTALGNRHAEMRWGGRHRLCRGQMGAHAYLLNREGMRRVSAMLEVRKHYDIVDLAYARMHRADPNWYAPPAWISNQLSENFKRRDDFAHGPA